MGTIPFSGKDVPTNRADLKTSSMFGDIEITRVQKPPKSDKKIAQSCPSDRDLNKIFLSSMTKKFHGFFSLIQQKRHEII